MIGFSSKRPNFGGLCAELWTRLEQQMHAVSWTPLRATTGERENDDPLQDKAGSCLGAHAWGERH